MEESIAIRLIEKGVNKSKGSNWADLGAGVGTFTKALASLLGSGNEIYAIDQNGSVLEEIVNESSRASVTRLKRNFIEDELDLPLLDGILMANSLHYVKAKNLFLVKLRKVLKPDARIIIVEYERRSANQWVPYPIDFISLVELMKASGFSTVQKIGEQPSFYQGAMYSALVR